MVVSGAAVAVAAAFLIPDSWPMLAAMFVGMLGGMILVLPISFVFQAGFGAFEIMIPTMLTGMISGMVAAMKASTAPMPLGGAALLGAACGIGTLLFTYIMDAMLRGETA